MSRGVGVMELLRDGVPKWTLEGFATLTLLGDLLMIVPVLGLLYLVDIGRSLTQGNRDRPLCSDQTAFLVAAVFGGLALVVLLKAIFALPRPPAEFHVIEPSEHGFPSGHTMAATIFWGALVLWLPVSQRSVRLAVAGVIVPLVGISRLALGVHYLVDILASMAFGAAYLAVIAWLTQGRPERAFGVAIAVAVLGAVVTQGSGRAVLALVGTVGAAAGWWVVELRSIRKRLFDLFGHRYSRYR
ncbi:phosphatase PAP2 family protein [Natronorubrum thiooxidans]|uniref:PAP2 superfamily protein n=1 Tax=Natronorubrum thiooxidans TaxID=308853 RepID=A0A1N7GDC9_9EURY|nr:phosphatase PAP2 family protein [Natronorubrum thiooxidans]SIS10548.1 PAP2 superfamily protein [Natronorubrum thiooxidans]